MLLAALLLFLLAGPSAAQTDAAVSCDSEAELLGSLTWVRDACSQAGEQFDDDDTLVPGAVTTRGCAEVVRRVEVSMLLLAVPAIVLPTGLTRRFAATPAVSQPNQPLSAAASRPELVCQPVCTPPIGLPSLSRVPWRTGTWQCVASRRLVWSPSPFRPAVSVPR